jgi:peptidoglycan/LPS O-acetylase OafA/YrhL
MADVPSIRLPSHIPALDGVRGLAIALVLLVHMVTTPIVVSVKIGNWQYHVWYWTKMMWVGVDLFFVLSGFLITKIILQNQNSSHLFKTFYARRACRILPLYAVVLATAFLAQRFLPHNALWHWLFGDQFPLVSYLTFTQNIMMGIAGTSGGVALAVTWSLAVEEQFYLILPATIRLIPKDSLPWLCVGGISWAYLARMQWPDGRSNYWPPARADALLVGCLIAWLCAQPKILAWLQLQTRGLMLLLGFLAIGLLMINRMPEYYRGSMESFVSTFFGVFVVIVITQKNNPLTRCLEMPWLGYLGKISYGVYLLHFPLLGVAFWLMRGTTPAIYTVGDLIVPLVALLITILIASLSWFLYEKHWVKLGHRVKF